MGDSKDHGDNGSPYFNVNWYNSPSIVTLSSEKYNVVRSNPATGQSVALDDVNSGGQRFNLSESMDWVLQLSQ